MEFLTLLNQHVEILIRPSRDALSPGHVTVHSPQTDADPAKIRRR
jgi:hypothetical protein